MVFGSVSLLAQENEQMLKVCETLDVVPCHLLHMCIIFTFCLQPHLHTIVNKSMDLALCAKEPYNYFLLLRALFRSIGGGSHDLLYQEFLPLLPNLLQGALKFGCIFALPLTCDLTWFISFFLQD